MESHEAIQKAINGKSLSHAKRLGVSLSLVSKWQEPSLDFSDSGAYNPLDRIKTIVEGSRADGNSPERFLAPLDFLERTFNRVAFSLPEVAVPKDPEKYRAALMQVAFEMGEAAGALEKGLARDNALSAREKADIRQEVWDVVTRGMALYRMLEE